MKDNIYVTTGEFAKMTGTTKDTLFHYDDIKLFCPEIVTDNGYRYYSVYQIETFQVIVMLKDLGMPLKEIANVLNKRNANTMAELFLQREKQIDDEIKRLKNIKKFIEQKRQKIIRAETIDYSNIEIKEYGVRYYLYNKTNSSDDKEIYKRVNDIIEDLEKSEEGSKLNYEVAFFQYADILYKAKYNEYNNVALMLNKRPTTLNYKTLPKGKYLTAYHKGHWNSVGETYEKIFDYKRKNNITTDDTYIESYMVDNLTVTDIEDYVTEISVRILE